MDVELMFLCYNTTYVQGCAFITSTATIHTHTYLHTFSLMNIINILIFCDKHPSEDRYIILLKHTFCVETNYQFEGMFTIYMTTLYDKGFVTLQIWNFFAIIQISFQNNISIWLIAKYMPCFYVYDNRKTIQNLWLI